MLHIAQVTRGDGGLAAYVVRDETGAQVFPRPDRTDAAETEAACADYIARNPRATCEWCGGEADPRTTCPKSVECPTCHAKPGSSCRRPSGHRAMSLHAGRIALAESTDPGSQLPLGAVVGESVSVDARAAHSDAWEAFHRHGGPSPLDSRTTGETVPADCTGYIDELGHLAHDGDTCPVHESGDVDPGDEREHATTDAETFAALGSDVMLDQLASLARSALDDPGAVGIDDADPIALRGAVRTLTQAASRHDAGRTMAASSEILLGLSSFAARHAYTITMCDLIINTLNPAEMDAAGAAGAFAVLGRHIEDVRDRLGAEEVIEKGRSLIDDAIAAALDHLDQAIGALKGGDDVAA